VLTATHQKLQKNDKKVIYVPRYSDVFDYIKGRWAAVYFKNQKNRCISPLRQSVTWQQTLIVCCCSW